MFSFLTSLEINIVIGVVAFVAGVALSTKVTDWLKGVPAQARAALNNVEAKALADVKQAQADALSRIPGAVPAKAPLPPAAQPLAPAAAAPAPVVIVEKAPLAPAPAAAQPTA